MDEVIVAVRNPPFLGPKRDTR